MMENSEQNPSFRPTVELTFSPDIDPENIRIGQDIPLLLRFRDFLGETATDTGDITVSASLGEIVLPDGTSCGETVTVSPGRLQLNDSGEMGFILRPGEDFGRSVIEVECDLGKAEIEVDLPHKPVFALTDMLESVIYAFLVAIIIRIFFFQTFWIPSGSMEPTLEEHDRIIANKLVYRTRSPERGEVVIFRVFQPPGIGNHGLLTLEEAMNAEKTNPLGPAYKILRSGSGKNVRESFESRTVKVQDYIKRVIGIPGDKIEIIDSDIYINDELLLESFKTKPPDYRKFGPVYVPPGEVFVLGDNRANSQDSHVIGTVPIRNIEGRAELVFWPPKRMKLIPQGQDRMP